MTIHWNTAQVIACVRRRDGLQELLVRMASGAEATAIHYTDVMPALREGDTVLLNTTAVDLALGTGGFHFVYTKLEDVSGDVPACVTENSPALHSGKGHIMKLRYTPQQRRVLSAEELDSPYHSIFQERRSLERMPVLIGELHSMLPAAVYSVRRQAALKSSGLPHGAMPRLVYIMTDGGALPIRFSAHAAVLRELGWITGSITFGQAYGGDLETINKFTALIAAKHIYQADVAIVSMGPGIAGTGTRFGHTGVEIGELVNAVAALGGIPVVIPRISFADPRPRHQGLSHHLLSSLADIALREAVLPLPGELSFEQRAQIEQQLIESGCAVRHRVEWVPSLSEACLCSCFADYPLPITTMGRGIADDPAFFAGVFAASQWAWEHRNEGGDGCTART